jgi:hypothetical protein
MELVDQRADADWLRNKYAASQRRVCGLMGMAVGSYCYRSRRSDEPLRRQLVELARLKPRFGYRRLQVLMQAGGPSFHSRSLPLRNSGCPVLAFSARAGTMLPVPPRFETARCKNK